MVQASTGWSLSSAQFGVSGEQPGGLMPAEISRLEGFTKSSRSSGPHTRRIAFVPSWPSFTTTTDW